MGHNLWPINYRPYMVFSWALYHYPREKVARLSESRFLDILSVTRRHNLWDAENASGDKCQNATNLLPKMSQLL